jgi:hypothetical protein
MFLTKRNQWHCLLKSHLLLTTRQRFYFYWLRLCYHPLPFNDRSDTINVSNWRGLFVIQCHSGVPQGSHLGPIFFILNIDGALDIFKNVSVLGYADDLKLFMTIKCIGDCQLFQIDQDRLGEWCRSKKFDLNAGKCKSISFHRNMRPIEIINLINRTALKGVDEIKDLGVIIENVGFY